jgi:ABC-type nitrate/sulfonate/bicarbonate transport systems, periplasmic components
MKKILSVLFVLLLSISVFAACAKEPEADGEAGATANVADTTIRLASLKGPTTMGLVKLISDSEQGLTEYKVESTMYGTADEVSGLLINGDVDIAAIPANLASVLYNKTNGAIQVAAINTLGVLYIAENGSSVSSVADLKGKTIYSTGKGTTPEYVLNSLLRWHNIDPENDLTIEYKSEATEIAALLASTDQEIIAVLPQPYVTSVIAQNEGVRIALDITEEWQAASGKTLVTGVAVVRTEFAQNNPEAVAAFLADYKTSAEWINANAADASVLIEKYEIVAKAALAEKALPFCNITYIDGAGMQQAIAAYLEVLFEQNPESVGGSLPDEGFYYKS